MLMKTAKTKKLPVALFNLAITAVFSLLVAVPVYADSKPYFVTQNGGPFTGGWFRPGTGACGANYQQPTFGSSVGNKFRGAVLAFATPSRTGANSNLDAFATGIIEGNSSNDYGFYTGLAGVGPSPNGTRSLSFSNAGSLGASDFWGGFFEANGTAHAHCIPDYATISAGSTALPPGNFTGRTIAANTKITYLVNGNVNITGNVVYGPHDMTNVPKFRLIVRGNIYIAPNVTQLDGWYVAQPSSGTTGGVIWTCSNGTEPLSDTYIRANCNNKPLTINGALTAKQVNLTRVNDGSGIPGSPAETVNFSPEMVLGGGFSDNGSTSSTSGTIQSLISLPPVF